MRLAAQANRIGLAYTWTRVRATLLQQVLGFVGGVSPCNTWSSEGTAHEGEGCDQSIGSTVSDAIVRSWLWSTATRSSPLGYFSILLQVVANWPHICGSRFSSGRRFLNLIPWTHWRLIVSGSFPGSLKADLTFVTTCNPCTLVYRLHGKKEKKAGNRYPCDSSNRVCVINH